MLGDRPAADIFSWRSPTARKLGLAARRDALTSEELIRMMVQEPNLIRRPLFAVDGELVAGFDPPARKQLASIIGVAIPGPKGRASG